MQQSVLKLERPDFRQAVDAIDVQCCAPRMLIVDDDPSVLRLIADHCARIGFDVETAANGIQALVKANWIRPDVLIIDVNMPEADGLSVCAHLLHPMKEALPVIVITGSRSPETLERCKEFGVHYAYKGPGFWSDLETALAEIHPGMAGRSCGPAPARRHLTSDRGRACCLSTTTMTSTGSWQVGWRNTGLTWPMR